ncbi:hypothetical protein F0562_019691 [Nyssa sinensis]|uniref:Uncharacterized protein n=1 Tax=Nyssa sinensis TaxID=561372 RepID=A0A5J5BQI6_9ASTE|nr:hypothetical protein F0562_019691 [Nyssa sinensis]
MEGIVSGIVMKAWRLQLMLHGRLITQLCVGLLRARDTVGSQLVFPPFEAELRKRTPRPQRCTDGHATDSGKDKNEKQSALANVFICKNRITLFLKML